LEVPGDGLKLEGHLDEHQTGVPFDGFHTHTHHLETVVEIALEPADVSMGQPAIIHGWLVVWNMNVF